MTRLFILHDQDGNIVSAMQAYSLAEDVDQPYGGLKEGEAVIEVDPTAELKTLAAHEIMERYTVDLRRKQLKKKD